MVKVYGRCPVCGKETNIEIPDEDYEKLKNDKGKERLIDLFPHWTPEQREFFLSGVCDECWNIMAQENEE